MFWDEELQIAFYRLTQNQDPFLFQSISKPSIIYK